jgi:hypothetical protein
MVLGVLETRVHLQVAGVVVVHGLQVLRVEAVARARVVLAKVRVQVRVVL